jgi:hypothetical protein
MYQKTVRLQNAKRLDFEWNANSAAPKQRLFSGLNAPVDSAL